MVGGERLSICGWGRESCIQAGCARKETKSYARDAHEYYTNLSLVIMIQQWDPTGTHTRVDQLPLIRWVAYI